MERVSDYSGRDPYGTLSVQTSDTIIFTVLFFAWFCFVVAVCHRNLPTAASRVR